MLHYRVALNQFYKLGPITLARLRAKLGSVEAIWQASAENLAMDHLSPRVISEFVAWRNTQDPQALLDDVVRRGMNIVTIDDPNYPQLLKTIHDPPQLLYYRGTLPPADALCVGVVGSRKATGYGLQVAFELSRDIAKAGVTVVSGLAYGVDEAAHRATLEAGGITIAVLGSGLDGQDAPRKEKLSAEIVARGGAVISEFPPLMPALTHHFPIRNRLISGISKGTLIVEAAEKSGSLLTARAAMEEGREVFAVPGPITSPTSQGTNRLCKDGAHVTTCAQDVLDVLGVTALAVPVVGSSDPAEVALLDLLSKEPQHVDDIARAAGQPSSAVSSVLTMLEIKGLVRHVGGMRYIIS